MWKRRAMEVEGRATNVEEAAILHVKEPLYIPLFTGFYPHQILKLILLTEKNTQKQHIHIVSWTTFFWVRRSASINQSGYGVISYIFMTRSYILMTLVPIFSWLIPNYWRIWGYNTPENKETENVSCIDYMLDCTCMYIADQLVKRNIMSSRQYM